MKLQYLGTAAAEGIPAIFCHCDNCIRARETGGKNMRTRSQALLDGKILIDFGPDTYMHALKYNLNLIEISTCLVTHSHSDHLYADDLALRRPGFASFAGKEMNPLNVYGSTRVGRAMTDVFFTGKYNQNNIVTFTEVKAYEPFTVEDGYTVTPLPAIHDIYSGPLVYIIEKDGRAFLYMHDSDISEDEVFDYLKSSGIKLNYVSLDCTAGKRPIKYHGHMSYERCLVMRDRLKECGATNENTRFCLNHFSHNGISALYEDMIKFTDADGFMLSYDGMTVEI